MPRIGWELHHPIHEPDSCRRFRFFQDALTGKRQRGKELEYFGKSGYSSDVKGFISNVFRWFLFWMPIRLASKKVSPLVSVSSNHRYDIIKSTMLKIIENNGVKFHEIEVPVVIIDMAFGHKDRIGRFYPPFKCQMLCLVMEKNASDQDVSNRLEYYFSNSGERSADPGLATWTDEH